jgi:hypothetical protein
MSDVVNFMAVAAVKLHTCRISCQDKADDLTFTNRRLYPPYAYRVVSADHYRWYGRAQNLLGLAGRPKPLPVSGSAKRTSRNHRPWVNHNLLRSAETTR